MLTIHEDLLEEINEEPTSGLDDDGKYKEQSNSSEDQSQLVGACSSDADCPQAFQVCSKWAHGDTSNVFFMEKKEQLASAWLLRL